MTWERSHSAHADPPAHVIPSEGRRPERGIPEARKMKPARQFISRAAANPLLRRMLRNSGYLLSANGLATAGSMLQGALAARLIGVEGLGIIGLVTDFATNVKPLTSLPIG